MIRKIIKLFVYYLSLHISFFAMSKLAEKPLFDIISLENLLISDASLNDLYYQLRSKSEAGMPRLSGKVIMVNTGSLPSENFRSQLAITIEKINQFNPLAIGVDHTFKNDTLLPGTNTLISVVDSSNNLILAKNNNEIHQLPFSSNVKFGVATLPPDQSTIRRYYADSLTFGYQLAHRISGGPIDDLPKNNFVLNYLTDSKGYFTVFSDDFLFYNADPDQKQSKFLLLEARDILNNDSVSIEALHTLADGRVFILGHFANTCIANPENDIEDKHRVPSDGGFVDRDKTMPGMLIHANAIENMLNKENMFSCWTDTLAFFIFEQILILLFLYYLLFTNMGKAINVLCILILSIILIYVVLFLMTKHIYLEMGLSLLQILVMEEIIEIFESIYRPVFKKLNLEK